MSTRPEGFWTWIKILLMSSKSTEFLIWGCNRTELTQMMWSLLVFLNKAPIAHKSNIQGSVLLGMAKGELIAACEAAQIMLSSMRVLEDIGLCVKKPMILQVDCKGVLDLTYGWTLVD